MKRALNVKEPICSRCGIRNAAKGRRGFCWVCYRADLESRREMVLAVNAAPKVQVLDDPKAIDLLMNDILNLKG